MVELTDSNYEDVVSNWDGDVLIDFYANWCGPCKVMSPIIESIEDEYPSTLFCKVNVDENVGLVDSFNVQSMPTFVVFNPDNETADDATRLIGAVSKEVFASTLLVK